MYIIPVVPATLDILEKLNGGVRPEIEIDQTLFIYNGEEEPSSIISMKEFHETYDETHFQYVTILYLNK